MERAELKTLMLEVFQEARCHECEFTVAERTELKGLASNSKYARVAIVVTVVGALIVMVAKSLIGVKP